MLPWNRGSQIKQIRRERDTEFLSIPDMNGHFESRLIKLGGSAPDSPSCPDQIWPADKLSWGEKQLATLFAAEAMKRDHFL